MPIAKVKGHEISYEIHGEGPPVLFIHGGFGGVSSTLTPSVPTIIDLLPSDYLQIITYDRRGAGQSEYVTSDYTLRDLAGDARGLLVYLGIEGAIVIGNSMGGMVAMQLALLYPDRVAALALLSTGASLMSQTTWGNDLRSLVAQMHRDGDEVFFKRRLAELHGPTPSNALSLPLVAGEQAKASDEKLLEKLASVSDDDLHRYFAGEARNWEAFLDVDLSPDLGAVGRPTCIIHGTADPIVPFASAEALKRDIPHAELFPIEGVSHDVLDFPEAAGALRGWVSKIAALS